MKESIFAAVALMALGTAAFGQTGTLDQQSPMTNASYNLDASFLIWQQQVRVGVAGQLEGFQLTIQGNAGAQFNARVRVGDGWNTGAIVFQNLFTKPNNGNELMFIDVTSANIMLNVNDSFVIETQGNDTGAGLVGNAYPPGYAEPLYLNGPPCFADCQWRHGFNSYMLRGGCPSDFTATKSGSCPGSNMVSWTGAPANSVVRVLYTTNNGSGGNIPNGPCAGTRLCIGLGGITLHTQRFNSPGGSGNTPNFAAPCGLNIQLITENTCKTSNKVTL